MSVQTPPTLKKLAKQALLRGEALAITALEELPPGLFPGLFMEAFPGRHSKLVKAIVAAWPFPCLPVGEFMRTCNLETFEALLDGVDMHQAREFHPRRTKLQVLDLRNVHYAFWNTWAGEEDRGCSAETLYEKEVMTVHPRYVLRPRLKVIVDLCVRYKFNDTLECLLKWGKQRKDSLHFYCRKMTIWGLPVQVIKILNVFQPQHIAELELNTDWSLLTLAHFAPCFGQMRKLHKVSLSPFYRNVIPFFCTTSFRGAKCINTFISQFSKFNCLQHLFMSRVHFLKDQMSQTLGSLKTPLETLSITHCIISQEDLDSFSCCHSLFQLKCLAIRGVVLYALDPMPLRGLLEKVAKTPETLDFQWCKMKDSQLNVLLPALRQCCQLTKINFYNNHFSMLILKDLLQHTANWSKMSVEQYPAPLACYDELGHLSRERFAQICLELMDILRAIRQPGSISFATERCHKCGDHCVYGQGARLCSCLR